ncbi:MAG TPA: Hsp20/alpha crystallin family protein [Ktedonobacteraceae bacterium]|jgi:HSP20 family protein|nr:Hsp20/alpha crystallin family protein [Ktedonobacteraceae bacterium]
MLTRYDPFREMLSLRDAMNQLFEQSFVRPTFGINTAGILSAPIDVLETEQGYSVKVLLPGVKPEDIDLTVRQNTLTIKGQYTSNVENKQGNWLVREIGESSFERTVTFDKPIDADKVETQYENGVLTIFLPIHEASRPKRISVSAGQQKQLAGAH